MVERIRNISMVERIRNISFVTSDLTSFNAAEGSIEVGIPSAEIPKGSFLARQRNAFETAEQKKEYENLFRATEAAPVEEVTAQGMRGHNLVLYYAPGCPYCDKVFKEMERLGINIPLKNARNSAYRRELVGIGGKAQVPCLIVDGRAIYESDAIIAWLRQNYGLKAFAEGANLGIFSDLEDFPKVEGVYKQDPDDLEDFPKVEE